MTLASPVSRWRSVTVDKLNFSQNLSGVWPQHHLHSKYEPNTLLVRASVGKCREYLSRFMGSRSLPRLVLCVCVRVCEQVSVGVCDWGWFAPAESHYLGYIRSCHAVSLCQILAVSAVFWSANSVRSCSWFRDSRALLFSWTPNTGDSSAHCFPALPASAYGELHHCFAISVYFCNKPSISATESSRLSLWQYSPQQSE